MNIFSKIKRWFMKLFDISQKVIGDKDIPNLATYYERINKWLEWYKGFDKDFHEVSYNSLGEEKKRVLSTMNSAKFISDEVVSLLFTEKVEINIAFIPFYIT